MRYVLFISIAFLGCLSWPVTPNAETLYKWYDETGMVHIVDRIRMVPQGYRDQIDAIVIEDEGRSAEGSMDMEIEPDQHRPNRFEPQAEHARRPSDPGSEERRALSLPFGTGPATADRDHSIYHITKEIERLMETLDDLAGHARRKLPDRDD